MRLDGLEVKENEINRFANSLNIFKKTPIKNIHLRKPEVRHNYKDWDLEADFIFQNSYFPKPATEKEVLLDAIQKVIKNYLIQNNCMYKGKTLYLDKLNIVPNGVNFMAIVLFDMKCREEYAGCSPKIKTLLKKFKYRPQADNWGFFEEECWGLAIKPKGDGYYELRNNTGIREQGLPGASTRESETSIINALMLMAKRRGYVK